MSWRHTTKLALRGWLAGATFACASAHAAPQPYPTALRVKLLAAPAAATAAPAIGIYGRAPAHCAPEVDRVTLDGTDLGILLKSARTGCDVRRSIAFALRVDPAASARLPLLPGQVYRVRVYADEDGAQSLLAFRLLDTTASAAAPQPENGMWWSQAGAEAGAASAGSGASMEFQDGQIAVGLFGFNDAGAATWYFGSAPLDGRVARVSLVQLADGDPLFAPLGNRPTAEAGPRLEIEFSSPSSARAWLVRNENGLDLEVRPLALARSRFSTAPLANAWTGEWVLVPDEDGTPRTFEFSDSSSKDAETFHLSDQAHDASLDCRVVGGTRQPDVCTLSVAAATLADFDQVGIDHLVGRGVDGARMRLVRVPR